MWVGNTIIIIVCKKIIFSDPIKSLLHYIFLSSFPSWVSASQPWRQLQILPYESWCWGKDAWTCHEHCQYLHPQQHSEQLKQKIESTDLSY